MITAGVLRQAANLFVFPFVCFASMVPVIAGLNVVLTIVEYSVGWRGYAPGVGLDDFTTLYFNGDVVGIASLTLIGGATFGLLGWGLGRLEGIAQPALGDHLRRCSFLYVFVALVGALFAAEYVGNLVAGHPMYDMPKGVIVWVVAGYAILVDAVVLVWQRRHLGRADSGSGP